MIKELDREEKENHLLLVKATEDCLNHPPNVSFFDPKDDTLLKVIVYVNDINDNAPRFVKRVFTGGVTTEADFGTEFMQVKVSITLISFNLAKKFFRYLPIKIVFILYFN